jgi:hypothetical protein
LGVPINLIDRIMTGKNSKTTFGMSKQLPTDEFSDIAQSVDRRVPAERLSGEVLFVHTGEVRIADVRRAAKGARRIWLVRFPQLVETRVSRAGLDRELAFGDVDAVLDETYQVAFEDATAQHRSFVSRLTGDARLFADAKANSSVYSRLSPVFRFVHLVRYITARFGPLTVAGSRISHHPWIPERPDFAPQIVGPGLLRCAIEILVTEGTLERSRVRNVSRTLAFAGNAADRCAQWAIRHILRAGRVLAIVRRYQCAGRGRGKVEVPDTTGQIAVMIGGASQWESLRPWVKTASSRWPIQLVSYEILRSPSAEDAVHRDACVCQPLERVTSLGHQLATIRQAFIDRKRLQQEVQHSGDHNRTLSLERTSVEHVVRGAVLADLESLPEMAVYTANLQEFVQRYRPSVVVSANTVDAYISCTTRAARAMGIKHVCIQNAAMQRIALPNYADCDIFCVEGPSLAKYLSAWVGAGARLRDCGLPKYDALRELAMRRALIAKGSPFTVLVTTQPTIDFVPVICELQTWARRRGDVRLIVKLHPREHSGKYRDVCVTMEREGYGERITGAPLEPLLERADVLASCVSTTILSGLLAGVPCVACVPPRYRPFSRYVSYLDPALVAIAQGPAEVPQIVEGQLVLHANESVLTLRRDAINAVFAGADGLASSRLSELIEREICQARPLLTVV